MLSRPLALHVGSLSINLEIWTVDTSCNSKTRLLRLILLTAELVFVGIWAAKFRPIS